MVDLNETRSQPQKQFMEQIGDVHACMLHLEGSGLHGQPMAPKPETGTNRVWFFGKKDSAIYAAMKDGHDRARVTVVGGGDDFYASALGRITEEHDRQKIDELWSMGNAAWFENGREDPNLCLLKVELEEGEVWGAVDSKTKFGWEIVKANIKGEKMPEAGAHVSVKFD